MQQKADAMQLYKEAAMISMVCASLPQITREIAGPYVICPFSPHWRFCAQHVAVVVTVVALTAANTGAVHTPRGAGAGAGALAAQTLRVGLACLVPPFYLCVRVCACRLSKANKITMIAGEGGDVGAERLINEVLNLVSTIPKAVQVRQPFFFLRCNLARRAIRHELDLLRCV